MSRRIVGTLILGDQDPIVGGDLRLTALDNFKDGATGVMRNTAANIPVAADGSYDFDLELGQYRAEYVKPSGDVLFLGLANCSFGADTELLDLIPPFGCAPSASDYSAIIDQLMGMIRGDVIIRTASFALDVDSQNDIYVCDSANSIDVTVPSGYPEGWYVTLVKRGTGDVNIISDGATVIVVAAPFVNTLRAQGSTASLNKLDMENWILAGDLRDSLP